MRRRGLIIGIVALLCLGGFVGRRMLPRTDARLVGRWVETSERHATAEEIACAGGPAQFRAKTNWSFRADGSGSIKNIRMGGTGVCRWRVEGDQLFIRHVSEGQSLRAELVELWNVLAGARRRRWREFEIRVDDSRRLRLEYSAPNLKPSRGVVYLTRIDE